MDHDSVLETIGTDDPGVELVAGRYELGRLLGEGRYGQVYFAHDRRLEHDVAIKLLRGQPDTTTLFREAAYLKALESPYILRVENADVYQDVGYLATEVAAGGSAEDQLRPEGSAPEAVLPLIRQALIGLRACHDHGLIHCDVKPANLFLHERVRAALGDFGAAQRMDERAEVRPAGDPLVRAPEMLQGGRGNVRTDIYSVGVTLYRLLTGRWPVDWSTDFTQLRTDVVAGRYDSVADSAPHVPRALVAVVRTAMSLSPAARYQSAEAMSLALSRVDLGRRWARQAAHAGHLMCWVDAPMGEPSREVCVTGDDKVVDITTRRATGSRTRVTALSRTAVRRGRIPIDLRRVFSSD